ncbi:hypothetical protein L4F92_09380 [Avibacterium sp. 21-595]|uniref:hypothetical protein n=1 Tax=Avibacterium sp. 21-595 TaxID=2911527 RepID=UPI00202689AA|nr:hypothetical protein [Avibacterium sp. 21-595]URL06250.1 hypothetical protein L4F92_09380 [Avibacterium sp. 21-595]
MKMSLTLLRIIFLPTLFYLFCSLAFGQNTLSLQKQDNKLILNFQLDNAKKIVIDPIFNEVFIPEKSIMNSNDGKFKVTLHIKPITSEDFYDPLRLYSNGEFLLYSEYLFPYKIIYKNNTTTNKNHTEHNKYPLIKIKQDPKNYVLGKRYIFFGKPEKIKIIGLPENAPLQNKLHSLAKDIFSYYAKKFGHLSKKEPIMIIDFTHNNQNRGNFYYKGDAIENFLSYNVNNVLTLSQQSYFQLYQFIAHEIFHLWNAYEHEHKQTHWLHEGSADYFAFQLLSDLGYIKKDKLEKIKSAYLTRCRRFYLDKQHKNEIMNNSNNDSSIYFCGTALHIILEKLASPQAVENIWKAIFKKPSYHNNDFWKLIKNSPNISPRTKQIIYAFIYKKGGVIRTINTLKK